MPMLNTAPFFASHSAASLIQDTLHPAHFVRIATAYFEPSGYQVLQDVLAAKHVHLLIGREEGGQDRLETVLNEFVERFLSRPLERRTQAMRQMLHAMEQGQLLISLGDASDERFNTFLDARYLYQHAKLYIADEAAVVVTSANFSYHGLVKSIEAGIRVTEPEDVAYFVRRFDEYFNRARSITDALIERLRQLLAAYPPYYVYARALLELYDLPDEAVPAQLPPLSDYQKPVVSRTLQSLHNYRGAMMIASTGLGKTVMAAHIAAYLRMQGDVDRVLVICPAGLKENWRRHMAMARMSSVEFSYSTFSLKDPIKFFSLRQLEYELEATDSKTLVLIDESHHLRNPKHAANRQKERYERVIRAIHKHDAYALLLTATPFSRGIQDVNAQLALLPATEEASKRQMFTMKSRWEVKAASELPNLPPCPTLTTPTVVHQFSSTDEAGHRFVVFAKGGRRYFLHRIHLRTVTFENPLDELLIALLDGHLLQTIDDIDHDSVQMPLMGVGAVPAVKRGGGLIKAEMMKQFCSSPAQTLDLMTKLGRAGGFKKMRFANQDELTRFVKSQRKRVEREKGNDLKLRALLEIIHGTSEKIVVFCYYRQTARDITVSLQEAGIRAETTESRKGDQVDSLLRRFAPRANEVESEIAEDGIQVLVVTSALAEGFNLQDASILINYDLPWTVLVLAQRMGRVLRPWHEPREIFIYNFVPHAMLDPKLQIAMRWHERLQERSAQHRALADIPVMTGVAQEGYEMAELAQHLYAEGETTLDLDDVLTFIEKAEQFGTSSFFTDLLQIKPHEREVITALPPGFRSALRSKGAPQLFLLVRHRRRPSVLLFDRVGKILLDAEQRDHIIARIRCTPSTPLSTEMPEDNQFDGWIERCRQTWCGAHNFVEDEVQILCALALTGAS
jgi:superfamily II DNA or RNA helicase